MSFSHVCHELRATDAVVAHDASDPHAASAEVSCGSLHPCGQSWRRAGGIEQPATGLVDEAWLIAGHVRQRGGNCV